MWTRVKAFFRLHFNSCAAIDAALHTQVRIEEVCGLVFALSAKLTYLQTRQKIVERSVCELDNAVTKLVDDRYPKLTEANAKLAAERVHANLQTRGVIPVLPSLTGTENPKEYEYATGPSKDIPTMRTPGGALVSKYGDTPPEDLPDDDPSAPGCTTSWVRPAPPPPGAVIDSPYPWKRDPGAQLVPPPTDDGSEPDCEVRGLEHANHCDGNCTSPPCR